MSTPRSSVFAVFARCDAAIGGGRLIERPSARDKEFAFQNWFAERLREVGFAYTPGPRNSYPDFALDDFPEGYEVKGLETPGRVGTFDANSANPTGRHRGREIFYVFGRYPKDAATTYPVVDLVLCHGDFLNADHDYVHRNLGVRGFGSYGDIYIRDRKMYVVPFPYTLIEMLADHRTLILPDDFPIEDARLRRVGAVTRRETDQVVVGYTADLQANTLQPITAPRERPAASRSFVLYRLDDSSPPA